MNRTFFPPQDRHVQTSQGRVDLPILYYDTSAFYAFFEVAAEKAATLLRGTCVKPVVFPGGKTFAGIAAYEYRATTVGVYNEVGLALVCVPENTTYPLLSLLDLILPDSGGGLGFYIADLPVTTAAANAAGREIWGYPKFVTQIPLSWKNDELQLRVMHPDSPEEPIMALQGPFKETVRLPNINLTTWTNLDEKLIRTRVTTQGKSSYCLKPDITLAVGQRDHRMQRHLLALGLDGMKPVMISASHDFQSILPAGEIFAAMPARNAESTVSASA